MAKRFLTTITKARFVTVGWDGQQMAQAADGVINNGLLPRIRAAMTVDDSPAPPLTPKYADQKAKKYPPAVRNWMWTGRTLRSMKTLTGSPNKAVIGFTDAITNLRAFRNNARVKQFGISPRDRVVVAEEFAKLPAYVQAKQV